MLYNTLSTKTKFVNVESVKAGAITSFISHACKPNADFVELHNRSKVNVLVGMIKNVKAGAQITMHYGNVTWFKCACYKCWDGSDDDRVSKD
ncbi:hypothetical protein F441_12193 [Phytophthora nicotianae CJ01A1]|uniref:SET domain-containing protein n=3 Tax=Phytophthora nicotianae TaxID=4792 RepID=W2GKB9_PHYNI|nr:hypothetical protein L915_11938 [Phytophthora nicotianae]ETL45773.1 hypothetical protein L916_04199 [Phytophthora nicotianae]ETO71388.1 hypothetical protein F444_12315 [Phytophthora nicotianae P1976]ETP12393.1 hypothetical protein F441_12193 [Phytophthora nicotianae CJ01A1]